MCDREEEISDQSSDTTDGENKYYQLPQFEDIPTLDGVALESAAFNSQIQDEFTISGLEQKLVNGMAKLKVDDMDQLSEKTQQAKERIKSYQEDDKEETDNEIQILTRFEHLTLLDETVRTFKSTESLEASSRVMGLYRLQQQLINGLAKLKVDDVNNLSEKIPYTETLINDYKKHDRKEEIDKEMANLTQMKHLTILDGTVTRLKTTESVEESNRVIEICWLEQELINGLEKLKIDNVKTLSGQIQQMQESINDCHGYGSKEDIEEKLAQLKYLRLLDDKITELKSTGSIEGSSSVMKSPRLGQELPTLPERSLAITDYEVQSNDHFTTSGSNKRFWPSGASNQSIKRSRTEPQRNAYPKFFVHLPEVKPVGWKQLREKIQQKYQQLCELPHYKFPGSHSVWMHLGNYEKILESPYMVTWKSVGKRYMMLIEERNKVYMLDEGNQLFNVDHIRFPFDAEYSSHLKDTLVLGEFVLDNVNGLFKPSFWINDIVFYNGDNVSKKSFKNRLKLISESIVKIRDSAIAKGCIKKTTQPFLIKNKYFFGLPAVPKLFSPGFLATIPHKVEGLFFQPERDPYMPGECRNLLKWKENLTIEFRLKITEKYAQLFLSQKRMDIPFEMMNYSSDLERYDNKIISCSYRDNRWHFHRLRDDRPFPNTKETADGVMDAMKRPVTREALCDLIKNQSKYHAHGDNSSSTP